MRIPPEGLMLSSAGFRYHCTDHTTTEDRDWTAGRRPGFWHRLAGSGALGGGQGQEAVVGPQAQTQTLLPPLSRCTRHLCGSVSRLRAGTTFALRSRWEDGAGEHARTTWNGAWRVRGTRRSWVNETGWGQSNEPRERGARGREARALTPAPPRPRASTSVGFGVLFGSK